MKLELEQIWIKNFFSVGANPLQYSFNSGLHGVIGKVVDQETSNGVGKSQAFIDAIIFAFFGVSIRNLNLDQMINSINEEECEVKIWFKVNEESWRIERGLKPNYVRLIQIVDGEDVKHDDGGKKEIQSKIQDLIKISLTTFINKITLNINYSKPFFKLKAEEKRQIFEDILNSSIYGKLLELVRKDYNLNRQKLKLLSTEVKALEEILENKTSTKSKIEQIQKTFEDDKNKKLKLLIIELHKIESEYNEIVSSISEKAKYLELKEKISTIYTSLLDKKSNIKNTLYNLEKSINVLNNVDACPTCTTPISNDSVKTHIENTTTKLNLVKEQHSSILLKCSEIEDKKNKIEEKVKQIQKLENKMALLGERITNYNIQIENLKKETISISEVISDDDIKESKIKLDNKVVEYTEAELEMKHADLLRDVLGDKGIKTYIVRQIIPILNKKMNEHLQMLNANYTVAFDNDFNEIFKSRRRDNFSYNNFSAGEQKRIDLAFMFSILSIAKMQNSIDCNVLILDEICDSSMCSNGIENLMTFLKTDFRKQYPDLCVYLISHKSEIDNENFNSIIHLKKENNFTKLDYIEDIDQVLQV